MLSAELSPFAVCLDISREMFGAALYMPCKGMRCDCLSDGPFDLIVAAAFLHHLPGREATVIEECARVLLALADGSSAMTPADSAFKTAYSWVTARCD